jgi:kynureninase
MHLYLLRDRRRGWRDGYTSIAIGIFGAWLSCAKLGAMNYYTGDFFDTEAITKAGHEVGAVAGWDLAHAAGERSFGVFVHEKHLADHSILWFAGWCSTDPATRFEMAPSVKHLNSVGSWQPTNPPILSLPRFCAPRQRVASPARSTTRRSVTFQAV